VDFEKVTFNSGPGELFDMVGADMAEGSDSRTRTLLATVKSDNTTWFIKMTGDEQQRLFDNTARAIKGARHETVETHIANCTQADPAYGEGVRKACEALGAL